MPAPANEEAARWQKIWRMGAAVLKEINDFAG
jgi:hypothetical protein